MSVLPVAANDVAGGVEESKGDAAAIADLDEKELNARKAFIPKSAETTSGSNFAQAFLGAYDTGAPEPTVKLLDALQLDYGTAEVLGNRKVRLLETVHIAAVGTSHCPFVACRGTLTLSFVQSLQVIRLHWSVSDDAPAQVACLPCSQTARLNCSSCAPATVSSINVR